LASTPILAGGRAPGSLFFSTIDHP
jgi:hypothetical protein